MAGKRFTAEQIIIKLREAEVGLAQLGALRNKIKALRRADAGFGLLENQFFQFHLIGIEQFADPLLIHSSHNDMPNLGVHLVIDPQRLHPLRLFEIVVRGAHIVDEGALVAVDHEKVDQGHQTLLAKLLDQRILIPD